MVSHIINESTVSLLWRHNRYDGVSNHQPHDCLFNLLFRRRSKKTSKLRVTGLCAGISPVTGEFPTQMAINAENVSIWWRHHVFNTFFRWQYWNNQSSQKVALKFQKTIKPHIPIFACYIFLLASLMSLLASLVTTSWMFQCHVHFGISKVVSVSVSLLYSVGNKITKRPGIRTLPSHQVIL